MGMPFLQSHFAGSALNRMTLFNAHERLRGPFASVRFCGHLPARASPSYPRHSEINTHNFFSGAGQSIFDVAGRESVVGPVECGTKTISPASMLRRSWKAELSGTATKC